MLSFSHLDGSCVALVQDGLCGLVFFSSYFFVVLQLRTAICLAVGAADYFPSCS